jgi:hypothetical protein
MKTTVALACLCGAALIPTTSAAPQRAARDPGVNAREHEQQQRIHEGVRSGELTPEEAKGLKKEERGLRHEERQFKSDGVLTAEERAKLQADQNKISRDIHRETHDAEVRGPKHPDRVVKARELNQQERIRQGAHSGQLTKDEVKGLKAEEKGIRREERQFKADGQLTPAERAKLRADQNQASRDIYKEKHDGDVRPGVTPPKPTPTQTTK